MANRGFQNPGVCLQAFPLFPSPTPLFHFLALAPFYAQEKHRKSRFLVFLCSQTPTETFATQATTHTTLKLTYQLWNSFQAANDQASLLWNRLPDDIRLSKTWK